MPRQRSHVDPTCLGWTKRNEPKETIMLWLVCLYALSSLSLKVLLLLIFI